MMRSNCIMTAPKILQRREGHLQSKAVRTQGDQNESMARLEKAPPAGTAACGKWAAQGGFVLVPQPPSGPHVVINDKLPINSQNTVS